MIISVFFKGKTKSKSSVVRVDKTGINRILVGLVSGICFALCLLSSDWIPEELQAQMFYADSWTLKFGDSPSTSDRSTSKRSPLIAFVLFCFRLERLYKKKL